MLRFTDERGESLSLQPDAFTIAGYTGRDRALVQKHIDELEREGIAPPPEVPMWYEMPVDILTTADTIAVPSAQSSGEVEPVLIGIDGALYLGIGSDHTARDLERDDIAASKRACPKPLGRTVARIGQLGAAYDEIALESWIDGEAYQSGSLAQLVPLASLLTAFRGHTPAQSFVLSCGTVPLLTHGFRFGNTFSAVLRGGPLVEPLTLNYTTTVTERT